MCVCVSARPGTRGCVCARCRKERRRSTQRFTVKALFEWSVYWLLNIDILLSGLRKEPRSLSSPYIHICIRIRWIYVSFFPSFVPIGIYVTRGAYNTLVPSVSRFLSFWKHRDDTAARTVSCRETNKYLRAFLREERRCRFRDKSRKNVR